MRTIVLPLIQRPVFSVFCLALALVTIFVAAAEQSTVDPPLIEYGEPKKLCDLGFNTVKESSGLAVSRVQSNVLWTHNDSGDSAQLYAFDLTGKQLGAYAVEKAKATDWEDMASFTWNGRPYLLVGDVGDNGRKRTEYQLYLIPERPLDANQNNAAKDLFVSSMQLAVERVVRFQYDRGPQDCESIAFDPTTQQVLLITKNWSLTADVYSLDWTMDVPVALPATQTQGNQSEVQTAKHIGQIDVPGVTAMDISPDGTRAIVLCYGNAYEYTRKSGETWQTAFVRRPREVRMPARKQGETVCFGQDGRTIFLTSEQLPTPLFCVSPTNPSK